MLWAVSIYQPLKVYCYIGKKEWKSCQLEEFSFLHHPNLLVLVSRVAYQHQHSKKTCLQICLEDNLEKMFSEWPFFNSPPPCRHFRVTTSLKPCYLNNDLRLCKLSRVRTGTYITAGTSKTNPATLRRWHENFRAEPMSLDDGYYWSAAFLQNFSLR